MSYDILAFDPSAAPSADEAVLDWYRQQAEWLEQHSYDDPSLTTPKLRAFYRDLIKVFPPMSGPDARADDCDADTDYAIGQDILYVSFRWAKADPARDTFIRLAVVHGVGVCEVSESLAAIHRPAGELEAKSDVAAIATVAAQDSSVPGAAAARAYAPAPRASADRTEEKGEGRLYL